MKYSGHSALPVIIVVLALSASGCLHARAKTVAATPPLDVPLPPPRIVQTTDGQVGPPPGLVEEPARTTPTRPPATAPPVVPPRAEAPKPDPVKPAEPPPVSAAAPKLQTTSTQQEAELETRIRADITSANNNLNRINYQSLSAGARTRYDTARAYIKQAEQELRARNYTFARSLADKAATIAAQLSTR